MKCLYGASLILGLLAASLLAGCGQGAYNGAMSTPYDASTYGASAYSNSSTPGTTGYDPTATGYGAPAYGAPGYGAPVYSNGQPAPYAPAPASQTVSTQHAGSSSLTTSSASSNGLVATVTGIDQTGIFGLGHVTVHVEVTNPTRTSQSGRLAVQFTNGGQPTGNLYSEKLTLAAGASKDLVFTSSAWKVNSAEAAIEADPASGAQSTQSTVSNAP